MTDFIISPEALAADLNRLAVYDTASTPTGNAAMRAAFAEHHIPGAKFLDFEAVFARHGRPDEGRHPWPEAGAVRTALLARGLDPSAEIVFYDNGAMSFAARALLIARQAGFSNVRILDGGFPAWEKAGLPTASGEDEALEVSAHTSSETCTAADTPFGPCLVTLDAMTENLTTRTLTDIDARPAARFHADAPSAIDPLPGHIPGAVSRPASDNLTSEGRMKDAPTLRAEIDTLLAAAQLTDPARLVHSCGSGVAACLNILAFDRAGIQPVDQSRIYAGSWSEWIAHPSLPREISPKN